MIIYNYILTRHARQRLEERDITIKDIENAIESPDFSYPGKYKERNVVKKIKQGRSIRVVYKEEEGVKIIITAMVQE